jgi:hypothetical protein
MEAIKNRQKLWIEIEKVLCCEMPSYRNSLPIFLSVKFGIIGYSRTCDTDIRTSDRGQSTRSVHERLVAVDTNYDVHWIWGDGSAYTFRAICRSRCLYARDFLYIIVCHISQIVCPIFSRRGTYLPKRTGVHIKKIATITSNQTNPGFHSA